MRKREYVMPQTKEIRKQVEDSSGQRAPTVRDR